MINLGVPHHFIQRYLGDLGPEMTSRYAHIHESTMREKLSEYLQGTLVDVTGKALPEGPLDTSDLRWFTRNVMAQALPNGYCAIPVVAGALSSSKCVSELRSLPNRRELPRCAQGRAALHRASHHQGQREWMDSADRNDWDFNALGAIFEQELHLKIGDAFRDRIAGPTQMQDFQVQDMYYLHSKPDSPEYERSRHPAYHFRMTARDLARFGYLMLRGGTWNGTQIIPSSWVAESTRSYSDDDGAGYGYLWWVNRFGLPVTSFSAQGALAKYVVVIPDRGLVVVYLNHAEFPDNASAMPAAKLKALPTISETQMSHLLQLLVEAQQPTPVGKQ